MSVAVATTTNTTWATGSTTLTLNKPTGVADGDLLIACIAYTRDGSSPETINSVPSGWTILNNAGFGFGNITQLEVFWKIASSEGSSWDWGFSSSAAYKVGGVLRITGNAATTPIHTYNEQTASNNQNPSFSTGITPLSANSLIVMVNAGMDAGSNSGMSNYALTTSSPTFTEAFEVTLSAGNAWGFSVAYGVRSAATSTGAWSYSYASSSVQDSGSVLLSVTELLNVSISPSAFDLVSSVEAPAVSGTANVSPTVVDLVSSVQAPTVTLSANPISNTDKSSTTWVNQNKS